MPLYYLSFCDREAPKGMQFLGATVVEAASPRAAVECATALGRNPGGEIAIARLTVASADELPPEAARYLTRFVLRDEVYAEGPVRHADEVEHSLVCQDCNPGGGSPS